MEPCNVTLHDVLEELKTLRKELVSREDFHAAFPLNTLGRPDVDGHRTDHEQRMTSAKNLENYKTKVVEKLLLYGVTGILTVFGFGFGPYVQSWIDQAKSLVGVVR